MSSWDHCPPALNYQDFWIIGCQIKVIFAVLFFYSTSFL